MTKDALARRLIDQYETDPEAERDLWTLVLCLEALCPGGDVVSELRRLNASQATLGDVERWLAGGKSEGGWVDRD